MKTSTNDLMNSNGVTRYCCRTIRNFTLIFILPLAVLAQTASVRGVVTDESGAVVPGAKVVLNGSHGSVKETASASDGGYSLTGLSPGSYTITASAPELTLPSAPRLLLKPGVLTLNLQLKVASTTQQVTVQENQAPLVTPDPTNNATALTLRGQDLDALSDDPDDLASDLQALAGPSAGPNGGSIYIDGFSGGQIPFKDSIREIRVNQNPFSPEYDKLGYGRVEIFTKPGSDKLHGTAFFNYANDIWNSRNPYAAKKAPFELKEYGGSVGGPLSKKASYLIDIRRDAVDNGAIINGFQVDPSLLGVSPFSQVYLVPQRRLTVSPRIDYQLGKHTLGFRYRYTTQSLSGQNIGGFNLISRGERTSNRYNLVQLSDTVVLSSSLVSDFRFQYFRLTGLSSSIGTTPAITVLGSFSSGSPQAAQLSGADDSYEFQNYYSLVHHAHSLHFGVRLRGTIQTDVSPVNFNGTFTFAGGLAPVLDASNQPVLDSTGSIQMVQITSAERYRRTLLFQQFGDSPLQIRSLGGGASQFTIAAGNPALSTGQMDAGFFFGDDWRVRANVTLSLGVRYEFQTNVHDWSNLAPRIGLAWAPRVSTAGSKPKTVIRAGFGTFFDRFSIDDVINARRYNGQVEQQYFVSNPDFFPNIPPLADLAAFKGSQSIQAISKSLRAPYILQGALSVERQLPGNTTVALTYAISHGLHLLRSRDVNAPLPGTYNPNSPGSGVYPLGAPGAVFLMESDGLYNQQQLIFNVNSRLNANVSLFGNYTLNNARSNTDGVNTFAANPYSNAGEYGPAATDVRHRMTVGGSLNTRWNVRFSPFIVLESGAPFNITTGRDLYGDTLFTSRPGIAIDPTRPGVVQTPYGLLDPNPIPGELIIPRNYGRGPGQVRFNMRLSKTFGFGPAQEGVAPAQGGPGAGRGMNTGPFGQLAGALSGTPVARKYNLVISLQCMNVINHTNVGPIIGNITSPLFGRANQGAGGAGGGGFNENANNRRLEFQIRLTF